MIERLINEINLALDHNLYFSALALTLILPDACARVEYPNKIPSERYKIWYKTYIGNRIIASEECPNIDETVAYNIRCCFLHEGNPNVNDKSKISKLELIFQDKDPSPDIEIKENNIIINLKYFDMYCTDSTTGDKIYRLNVRSYCEWVCKHVIEYYNNNKDKFSFDYTVVDWDEIKPK